MCGKEESVVVKSLNETVDVDDDDDELHIENEDRVAWELKL